MVMSVAARYLAEVWSRGWSLRNVEPRTGLLLTLPGYVENPVAVFRTRRDPPAGGGAVLKSALESGHHGVQTILRPIV